MAIRYNFIIIFISLGFVLMAQPNLNKVKINRKLSIKVPAEMTPMAVADQNQKFAVGRKIIAAFNTNDGDAIMSINSNSFQWTTGNLEILREFYRASQLNLYNEVKYIQDTIKEVNGRMFIVFEFEGRILDEENALRGTNVVSNYNYYQYTIYNNYVLLFSFVAPNRRKNYWQPAVNELMESVIIKN